LCEIGRGLQPPSVPPRSIPSPVLFLLPSSAHRSPTARVSLRAKYALKVGQAEAVALQKLEEEEEDDDDETEEDASARSSCAQVASAIRHARTSC